MLARDETETLITVFGGSGFLGTHVVRTLARAGYRIRVAVRRPELAGHLQPLGRVGQIHAVQANIRHEGSVAAALRDASVAINLVGILFERGRQSFSAVQAQGAGAVARVAAATHARLVHVSALGAGAHSASLYARSKAQGEDAAFAACPDAVVFRPSVVFGPEDDFLNRFASIARLSPVLPLIGGGHTRFQPVFAGDVAEAVLAAVRGNARPGTIYELGGPDVQTFRELMEMMLWVIGRKRLLVPVPFGIANLIAAPTEFLPKPMLTRDQVKLLRTDTVVSEAAMAEGRTLQGLGLQPRAMEAIVPSYLWRFRRAGQFENHAA
jgi:uncharacterized protein YbjT (DUF2867 family)